MPTVFNGLAGLMGDTHAIATCRAVAELRGGRPVLLDWPAAPTLAAAADTMPPDLFATFRAIKGASLLLTAERAGAIGLGGAGPMSVPLADLTQARAEALAAASGADAGGIRAEPATHPAEAVLDLCKRAHLLPAALVAPSAAVSVPPSVHRLTGLDLAACGPVGIGEGGAGLAIVSSARVPLASVPARFVVFRSRASARDQVAVIVGDPDPAEAVPVRLHSACLTGDLFGSLRCDCGQQLRQTMDALQPGGVLLYLDQEGRGTGLRNKMRAYALQDTGLDTIDADRLLGYGPDERRYDIAARMLRLLGFRRVRLLTNNPEKLAALAGAGIEVAGHSPLLSPVTPENRRYMLAKAERGGHMLEQLFGPLAESTRA